jgi:hypothetical protein
VDLVAWDPDAQRISAWLGDGAGGLDPGPAFAASTVVTLALADLDGDGRADLVTLDEPGIAESGPVRVRLATGGGAFGPPATVAANGTALAVADMDGDGALDVVAGTFVSFTALEVFLGTGAGTFPASASFSAPMVNVASELAVGDLDGDGLPDVVLTSYRGSDRVGSFAAALRGTGGGALGSTVPIPALEGTGPRRPILSDLDSDGRADLLAWPDALSWLVLLRSGPGPVDWNVGPFPASVAPALEPVFGSYAAATADVDRDGRPDLVAGSSNAGVQVLQTACRP